MELMSSFLNKICYANIKTCACVQTRPMQGKKHSAGSLTHYFSCHVLLLEISLGGRNGLCH